MNRYFAIGDIHGRFDLWTALFKNLTDNAKMDLTQDYLVQLGDKNDRGPDTFEVFESFAELNAKYQEHVICLLGNHEEMMINAVRFKNFTDFVYGNNGGKKTIESYGRATKMYGRGLFPHAVNKAGHLDFLMRNHHTYHETDDFFFCHAPISKNRNRDGLVRANRHGLLWNWEGHNTQDWVEPDFEGKIAVHGHITGIYEKLVSQPGGHQKWELFHPGVRRYGNTFLIDTGCGVYQDDGYLTALELPAKNIYTSKGEFYPWKT